MGERRAFYITTPIYYPSAKLHIGHAYTTVAADAMARYKRLRGFDVMFLTGTDEHGLKIQQKADEAGLKPLAYLDPIITWIQDLWAKLDISYDDYIRTTEERHTAVVADIFERLIEQDDIYLSDYEGWYCTPCESFWSERELVNGNCPDCGRSVNHVKEESYFFRMSKYVDRLLAFYEANPGFIQPESRKNEMINNFIKPGLQDLCVSRTSFDWGIPVGRNPKHVVYVWLDALTNYITAIGYGSGDAQKEQQFQKYWPADVHLVGKEIVRFHTIYWPIILMALDLPLPKRVYGHGFLLMKDGKMSKSKGNVIDPKFLIERYGSDAIRYFLLREIPFGQDGVFMPDTFMGRLNFDLANDFGNLVHRSVAMLKRFADGEVPAPGPLAQSEQDIIEQISDTVKQVALHLEDLQFSLALADIWQLVRRANKYIDENAPWSLHKQGNEPRLHTVLYTMAELIRTISILSSPFVPQSANKIHAQFNFGPTETTWDSLTEYGVYGVHNPVDEAPPLFPRLDVEAEIAELAESTGVTPESSVQKEAPKMAEQTESQVTEKAEKELIGIDTFSQVELKVGQVRVCERIEGADKLLRFEVDLGLETRQIVSGIAKYYEPEQLIGQKVIVVTNLKPVKLRGVQSNGMILSASQGNELKLATVPENIPNGAVVK